MAIEIKNQKFVHVVGTVDVEKKTGSILYVNPATVGVVGMDAGDGSQAELIVEDGNGHILARVHPFIRLDPCDSSAKEGLIQHDLPYIAGTRAIRLVYDGKEIARYDSAASAPPRPAGAAAGMSIEAVGASLHRRLVELPGIPSEPGVSYTVMVRPEGETNWQATSVGTPRPKFELDNNQFPGKRQVTVRVLRSTGIEDEIIAEEDVSLE
jgi:hypothetical protein